MREQTIMSVEPPADVKTGSPADVMGSGPIFPHLQQQQQQIVIENSKIDYDAEAKKLEDKASRFWQNRRTLLSFLHLLPGLILMISMNWKEERCQVFSTNRLVSRLQRRIRMLGIL